MRRLIALLAFATFAGCGSDGSAGTAPLTKSIEGTWTLQTVNGAPLPFVLTQVGANKSEATSDELTITRTAFTEVTQVRTTINGQVTQSSVTDTGTYVLVNGSATFRFDSDGSTGAGTVSTGTLTIVQAGITLVYSK